MKKKIVLDASVVISSLISHEPKHFESKELMRFIKQHDVLVIIPLFTIMEVIHGYFRAIADMDAADKIYKMFIDWNTQGGLQIINLESAFLIHFTANHHLFPVKTADAVVAVTSYAFKAPLVTWDKQLIRMCGDNTKTITPEEFLAQ
ncbi:MAG: PIN domain-containing protein [Patescibacteria group bacterium]